MNRTRSVELGNRVRLADGFWSRLRGLLGHPEPRRGEGLLITPCRAVHMYGMRYPLDVAFLDSRGEVVALYPALAPGTRTPHHRAARHALELPAGTLAATETCLGDVLTWGEASATPPAESRFSSVLAGSAPA